MSFCCACYHVEDAHEALFNYYQTTLNTLSKSTDLATHLRRFELKLLQELGYAVPLIADVNGQTIIPNKSYRYEAEHGASEPNLHRNGVQLSGKTLIDMVNNDYTDNATQSQSKQLMRYLLAHYLGDKPLHTRQLLIDLQGL